MSVRWDIVPNPNDESALPVVLILRSRRKNDLLVGGGPWDRLGDPGEDGESIGEPNPHDASGVALSAVAVVGSHMDWECETPMEVRVLPIIFVGTSASVVATGESDAVIGGADPGWEFGAAGANVSCTADMEREGSIDVPIPNPSLRTSQFAPCDGEGRADQSSCVAAAAAAAWEAVDEGCKLMVPPRAPRAREKSMFNADGLRVGVAIALESPRVVKNEVGGAAVLEGGGGTAALGGGGG